MSKQDVGKNHLKLVLYNGMKKKPVYLEKAVLKIWNPEEAARSSKVRHQLSFTPRFKRFPKLSSMHLLLNVKLRISL